MTPAKLLLFGEHTVLHGGEALALPLRRFGARWGTGGASPGSPFVAWAAFAKTHDAIPDFLDVERFTADAPGLRVESDIPRDYGLGSSGALTALVYRRYRLADADPALPVLRERLGLLEGFFHGRSSGLDPLVCYLDAAVHVRTDGSVATRPAPDLSAGPGRWFLLDSRQPKAGHEAIARFGESGKAEGFRQNYLEPALALTAALIDGARAPDAGWHATLAELSARQLEHLRWLIPSAVAEHWRHWLTSDTAYLKLCGAGGGGFFLGYAPQAAALATEVLWL